jgi:hypothetical protein
MVASPEESENNIFQPSTYRAKSLSSNTTERSPSINEKWKNVSYPSDGGVRVLNKANNITWANIRISGISFNTTKS